MKKLAFLLVIVVFISTINVMSLDACEVTRGIDHPNYTGVITEIECYWYAKAMNFSESDTRVFEDDDLIIIFGQGGTTFDKLYYVTVIDQNGLSTPIKIWVDRDILALFGF